MKEFLFALPLIGKDSLMITSFVLLTMLIIEYINIRNKGNWLRSLQHSKWSQVVVAALIGAMPGCLGAFTTVSLFTHGIIGFPALVAAMIAATGDEAFVMFAQIPAKSIIVFASVFVIGIVSGFILNLIFPKGLVLHKNEGHFTLHADEPKPHLFQTGTLKQIFREMSFQKVLLLIIGLLFAFAISIDVFEVDSLLEKTIYILLTFVCLWIVFITPDHFINEHIWEHIFKKHLLRIFLWTFGALLFIHVALGFMDFENWIRENQLAILLVATLIGIIPESGPHIIFISLYANGTIPLSILLANSIVQDGHGALPLLAESKKTFVALKSVNILIGMIIGMLGIWLGF